jgi:hypothetical protein
MSIQSQARALMSRHHQMIRNREQSMLLRTALESSLHIDAAHYHSHIQGKTPAKFSESYDRSHTTMS